AAAWYMKVVASGRDADFSVIQQFFGAMAKGQSLLQRFSEAFANDQSLHFHDVIDPEEATIQPTSVDTGCDYSHLRVVLRHEWHLPAETAR
ncbi:MAG: hypothetical protein RIF46_16320, partial [Cyclobacteriaceae bacterium]